MLQLQAVAEKKTTKTFQMVTFVAL